MHAIVLGAGVVGITTAYYLSQSGCRVTVVDRAGEVASGSSHANGGQLSYSFTESLAGHGFFAKVPGLLAGRELAIRVELSPGLLPWGLRFLAQCTDGRARANTLALLETAMRSATLLAELREQAPFDFSFRPAGKIILLSTDEEVLSAEAATRMKRKRGCNITMLSADEAIRMEPALGAFEQAIKAAVYSPDDEVGDARAFCHGLRRYLEGTGRVEFRLRSEARDIVVERGRVVGVECGEFLAADAVVMSMGAWSGDLLRRCRIRPRIYPVRGFSVTLPAGEHAPSASVTSLTNRFVMSRFKDRLRIAGFTDFDGFNSARDGERIDTLIETARRVAPAVADYEAEEKQPWGGFRPMTPDGRPLVGPTKLPGLYLNTGHGMLGWTLACATGRAVADAVVDGTNTR